MNERERQLIEGIINTDDRRVHNRAIQLLFHGQDTSGRDERASYKKNVYVVALENAVRTCFSGRYYIGRFQETYLVFESLFTTYLEQIKPETFREIDDLKNWLYVVAGRFCNSNRNKINELLGIDLDDNTETIDNVLKVKESETVEDHEEAEPTDDPEEQADATGWAESLLDFYISKIGNAYYRDLIRAIKLERVPVETIAEEYGKSTDDIYRDFNRAWDRLLQVTLPDIKIRGKGLFKKYESMLNGEQAGLLNTFFYGSHDTTSSTPLGKSRQEEIEKAIVKAYKVLLKTAKRENELDEKEKRRETREQHRLEKEIIQTE